MAIGLAQTTTRRSCCCAWRSARSARRSSSRSTTRRVMFAPNVVGTANATTAGWGNLGGGVDAARDAAAAERARRASASSATLGLAARDGRARRRCCSRWACSTTRSRRTRRAATSTTCARRRAADGAGRRRLRSAARDPRVWALFIAYGACFGVELTLDNVAALYFFDRFDARRHRRGRWSRRGFGVMNLFARALGGWLSRSRRQRAAACAGARRCSARCCSSRASRC